MLKSGWFHAHDQNFDVENEVHEKIDDYPHTKYPDDQLNSQGKCAQNLILHQK